MIINKALEDALNSLVTVTRIEERRLIRLELAAVLELLEDIEDVGGETFVHDVRSSLERIGKVVE